MMNDNEKSKSNPLLMCGGTIYPTEHAAIMLPVSPRHTLKTASEPGNPTGVGATLPDGVNVSSSKPSRDRFLIVIVSRIRKTSGREGRIMSE